MQAGAVHNFSMTTEKYISHTCAVLLIVSSIALAFYQVIDIDDVAGGTLMYIAQAFLLAGSIFGLTSMIFVVYNRYCDKQALEL